MAAKHMEVMGALHQCLNCYCDLVESMKRAFIIRQSISYGKLELEMYANTKSFSDYNYLTILKFKCHFFCVAPLLSHDIAVQCLTHSHWLLKTYGIPGRYSPSQNSIALNSWCIYNKNICKTA